MNCPQIEKLIPLYSGGDLPEEEEATVRDHLAFCEQCARIAGEFEESRDWLCGFTPPQFDQPVFDDLRDKVRREITRVQSQPSLLERLTPLLNIRFALVSSSALILLVAGLIFYINHRTTTTNHLSLKDKNGTSQNNWDNPTRNPQPSGEQQKTTVIRSSHRSKIYTLPTVSTPDPKTIVLKSNPFDLWLVAGEAVNSLIDESQTAEVDSMQEMMRFEFQTADPNIRIIWLTPKESKHNGETR